MSDHVELRVARLGACQIPAPSGRTRRFVDDAVRVALDVEHRDGETPSPRGFERAGARERVYFDPAATRAAIVTCGGLCPGLNDVVRSLVLALHHGYGVRDVRGVRFGFEGLNPAKGLEPLSLDPEAVRDIHRRGGSFLGLSRGQQDVGTMVDTLVRWGVNVLFCIGGDGTQRGAHAIAAECERRGLALAVVGIPKTIDNDIPWVDKTFGFDTAVEIARQVLDDAHAEARSARNGVGIVKLMGRDAGFITAAATLASEEVNFCLIPEVLVSLDGLLDAVARRIHRRGHCLIAVAEGCGAQLAADDLTRDASGNARYAVGAGDVGPLLRDRIAAHLAAIGAPATVKYLDPSYTLRAGLANASDAIFCNELARHAAHAAMAGRTDVLVGRWHRVFTHLPLGWVTGQRKRVDPEGSLWRSVLESTGQP